MPTVTLRSCTPSPAAVDPAARPRAAHPGALRVMPVVLVAAAVAVAVTGLRAGGSPPLAPVLILGGLVVLSEHRSVAHAAGYTLSAGVMIEMAAVVVCAVAAEQAGHPPVAGIAGPLIIGALSGLDAGHARERRLGVMAANAGIIGLAAASAAGLQAWWGFDLTGPVPALAAEALVLTAAFVAVNGGLVALYAWCAGGQPLRDLVRDLMPAIARAVPFAVVGVFLGRMYIDLGPIVAVLMVVPILVARHALTSSQEAREANEAAVAVLVRALEAKDPYTAGHAARVARYSLLVAGELGFGRARSERLRVAALMHDIGKVVVPNHLLNKPGRLTPEEFARVRAHESAGYEMLARIDTLAPIAHASLGHDPEPSAPVFARSRLMRRMGRRDDPSIESHIIAVADAYDAMTSTRSYRRALPQEVAFAELRAQCGTQFDARCVELLIRAIERRGERHGAGHEAEVHHWLVAPPAAGVGSAGLGHLAADEPPVAIDLTAAPDHAEERV